MQRGREKVQGEGAGGPDRGLVGQSGSAPAQLMQPVVVYTDMVPELVDHGDPDLLDEVVEVLRHEAQWDAVKADPVWQRPAVVLPLGQGDTFVQTQQVGLVRVLVLDDNDDVAEARGELGRQRIEGVLDNCVEFLRWQWLHVDQVTTRAGL